MHWNKGVTDNLIRSGFVHVCIVSREVSRWGRTPPPSFCLSRLRNSLETCVDHQQSEESKVRREMSLYKGPIQTSCVWSKSASNVCFCTSVGRFVISADLWSARSGWKWGANVKVLLKCSTGVLGKPSSSACAGVLLSLTDRAIIMGVFSWHLYDLTETKPCDIDGAEDH